MFSSYFCRTDTDIEVNRKLTGKDKAVLGYVWTMAVVYGVMSDQVLTKEVNKTCSVREIIHSNLSITSLVFGFILPLVVGPVAVIIAHFLLNFLEMILVIGPAPAPKKEEVPSVTCIVVLTTVCLVTYSVSMIVVEVYAPIYDNHFNFIMLKYVFGTAHHFLIPLCLLMVRSDLWELVKIVFRKGGSTQNKSVEMTYEEMQRELGLGVDVN